MRLYFPVDSTSNLIMIEKLVLGEIWTGDLPIFNPDVLTSAPSWQANIFFHFPSRSFQDYHGLLKWSMKFAFPRMISEKLLVFLNLKILLQCSKII